MNLLLKPYPRTFYARPTVEVARNLLGATLNRRLPTGSILSATISEVEAYTEDDPACHAYKGLTKRCAVLFGEAGVAYVYFIYGMYNCLNVVTEPEGIPGAVLIRGLASEGLDGPGKLCRQWQIDRSFNGASLLDPNSELWISMPLRERRLKIHASPRIGISQAQDRLWRFKI
jgi:DNA-3-methyladenine glycosylase